MKKIVSTLLIVFLLSFIAIGCAPPEDIDEIEELPEEEEPMELPEEDEEF